MKLGRINKFHVASMLIMALLTLGAAATSPVVAHASSDKTDVEVDETANDPVEDQADSGPSGKDSVPPSNPDPLVQPVTRERASVIGEPLCEISPSEHATVQSPELDLSAEPTTDFGLEAGLRDETPEDVDNQPAPRTKTLRVPSQVSAQQVCGAEAVSSDRDVLVIPVVWGGVTPNDPIHVLEELITGEVSDRIVESTWGAEWIENVDVMDWVTVPTPTTCPMTNGQTATDPTFIAAFAEAAIQGFNVSSYHRTVLYVPEVLEGDDQLCDFCCGIAESAGPHVAIFGRINGGLWAHEFLHGYGADHAGRFACNDKFALWIPYDPAQECTRIGTGNPADVMGPAWDSGRISAQQAFKLGWLPADQAVELGDYGTWQQVVISGASAPTSAIPKVAFFETEPIYDTLGGTYWLEYRVPQSFDGAYDQDQWPDFGSGIQVYRDTHYIGSTLDTAFLLETRSDFVPAYNAQGEELWVYSSGAVKPYGWTGSVGLWNTPIGDPLFQAADPRASMTLPLGDEYVDIESGLRIRPLHVSGDTITVDVFLPSASAVVAELDTVELSFEVGGSPLVPGPSPAAVVSVLGSEPDAQFEVDATHFLVTISKDDVIIDEKIVPAESIDNATGATAVFDVELPALGRFVAKAVPMSNGVEGPSKSDLVTLRPDFDLMPMFDVESGDASVLIGLVNHPSIVAPPASWEITAWGPSRPKCVVRIDTPATGQTQLVHWTPIEAGQHSVTVEAHFQPEQQIRYAESTDFAVPYTPDDTNQDLTILMSGSVSQPTLHWATGTFPPDATAQITVCTQLDIEDSFYGVADVTIDGLPLDGSLENAFDSEQSHGARWAVMQLETDFGFVGTAETSETSLTNFPEAVGLSTYELPEGDTNQIHQVVVSMDQASQLATSRRATAFPSDICSLAAGVNGYTDSSDMPISAGSDELVIDLWVHGDRTLGADQACNVWISDDDVLEEPGDQTGRFVITILDDDGPPDGDPAVQAANLKIALTVVNDMVEPCPVTWQQASSFESIQGPADLFDTLEIAPGDTVTYCINATNVGDAPASEVWIFSGLLGPVTIPGESLNPGADFATQYIYTYDEDLHSQLMETHMAMILGENPDGSDAEGHQRIDLAGVNIS